MTNSFNESDKGNPKELKNVHIELMGAVLHAMEKLGLHGRFFILAAEDPDWSCCEF